MPLITTTGNDSDKMFLEETCPCNCNYCTCNCNYCTCNCNYCTCDCNHTCVCDCNYACTCQCNYCTCNCNYCTCNCNYCTCDCNYCTCDCNHACVCDCNHACVCDCNYACTCNCNYCTCNCAYACTCNCAYACTCNCAYACTCVCNYACTCVCNYACTCNCNYACTCVCNYCTCNCNYCTCNCNYCTCNCNYWCTCDCNYSYGYCFRCSCFLAGTPVLAYDPETKQAFWKLVETFEVGDYVISADKGIPVRIKKIDTPILADRKIYEFTDGSLKWSSEHPFWTIDNSGKEWWWTVDPAIWRREVDLGETVGLKDNYSIRSGKDFKFATLNGFETKDFKMFEGYSSDTPLYLPVTENGEPIIIAGYVVTGGTDEFSYGDYSTFKWDPEVVKKWLK
jgi:hypothetical protein